MIRLGLQTVFMYSAMALASIAVLPICVFGQEIDHLDRAIAAWRNRRAAASSIDYTATGEGCFAKGSLTALATANSADGVVQEFPAADHVFPVKVRFAARLNDVKVRKERTEDMVAMDGKLPTFYSELRWQLFDGANGVRFNPDLARASTLPNAPQLVRFSVSSLHSFLEFKDFPLLIAHGIVPYFKGDMQLDDLAGNIEKNRFAVASEPTPETGGLAILRTASLTTAGNDYIEIWADPKRDYVVTRFVNYSDGHVRNSIELEYGERDGSVVLLSWRHNKMTRNRITHWYHLRVDTATVNGSLEDDQFVVTETPGMIVQDEGTGEVYVAGNRQGESTPLSVVMARKESANGRSSGVQWVVWGMVGLVVLLTTVLVFRRLRSA